ATVSPGVTLLSRKIDPAPVITAQPSSAARSSGMSLLIATQAFSWISICSAKAERLRKWAIGVPSAIFNRGSASLGRRVELSTHSEGRAETQNSQLPQKTVKELMT